MFCLDAVCLVANIKSLIKDSEIVKFRKKLFEVVIIQKTSTNLILVLLERFNKDLTNIYYHEEVKDSPNKWQEHNSSISFILNLC